MPELLTTKLYIPRLRSKIVSRPRLTNRITAGMQRKLTLICAPAGFGKTSLLSEWIAQSERCVTWLSLDEGDNDPARFWAYFIAALRRLNPDIGKNALALLETVPLPPVEVFLSTLLNEISIFPDSFAHVLDDYQTIQEKSIHAAIVFFLEHLPQNMHLIIASRTDPSLPLARLRVGDQMTEIRSADLCFAGDEAAVFHGSTNWYISRLTTFMVSGNLLTIGLAMGAGWLLIVLVVYGVLKRPPQVDKERLDSFGVM